MHSVAAITLTNTGYVQYTLNCLKSIKNTGEKLKVQCYCIGGEGAKILESEGYSCTQIGGDEDESKFQIFRSGKWSNVVFHKFEIIHLNLLTHDYVLITDGDIVYERKGIVDYLLENIAGNDVLCQSDTMDDRDSTQLCSGFMFIRKTPDTIRLFHPSNVEPFKDIIGWGDQTYVNKISTELNVKRLPLDLFPNGKYYFKHHETIRPYMIHFNWLTGNEKIASMKKYGKWCITSLRRRRIVIIV